MCSSKKRIRRRSDAIPDCFTKIGRHGHVPTWNGRGSPTGCRCGLGRSVDIGGRSLNIFCTGAGTPPVILESAGGPGYFWTDIQPQIAKFTTACWYDRAGEGWSDPGPFPRTSASIAADLHELLKRAGVPPPYLLVGASVGGLNSRVYHG